VLTILSIEAVKMSSPKLTGRLPTQLPEPMRSNIEGSWSYDTMSRRVVSDILKRIIEDNAEELLNPTAPQRSECFLQLNDLKSSLECGKTGYLRGLSDSGPDLLIWDQILSNVSEDQRNWLDAPWVISEFYFYRRIAEAFRFFETGYDMFVKQKANGLIEALPAIEEIAEKLPEILTAARLDRTIVVDALEVAIQTSLWGNKIDLSLWPAGKAKPGGPINGVLVDTINAGRQFILDDQTAEVVELLEKLTSNELKNSKRVIGIVVDNAGYELFSDLLLGHCLLELGVATSITYYTKGHPTFVSDATNSDALETIDFLQSSQNQPTANLATTFAEHVAKGQFVFDSDLFWCQPISFWDMPNYIQDKMEENILVFVKGDANYRRLLGEREWDLESPAKVHIYHICMNIYINIRVCIMCMCVCIYLYIYIYIYICMHMQEILSYWPVPVCALRTFKAEIGCGISALKQKEARNVDQKWLTSGKWGVVQLGGGGL
jgi:uncharacterized protein with ATP-grasp and redox domains